jgi:3-oxoacyl-[acyl-carrier-protein] synthase-1
METGFCALALRDGFVPGSANITTIDPACADLNIPQKTESRQVDIIMSNSSGFGGANVSLLLRRAQ